jgi:hypothetical protein
LTSALKPEEVTKKTLTPNQIVNQNLLNMETFPNVRCPATEPAFKIAETEDAKEAEEFGGSTLNASLQERYSTETKTDEVKEVYEMGCTTTLLNAELIADETLHVETLQSEPPGTKTIRATFTANAYNQSSFSLNFKKGTLSSAQGGIQTNYFSDTLGEAFSENTTVSCLESSGTGEGGVRFSLDYNPCFLNGFVAAYDAFQPKTGSRYTENRWRVRGGQLVYTFSDTTPRIPVIVSEEWRRTNTELEDLVVLGECEKVRTECVDVEPKQFGTHPPFLTLTRPCWKQKIFYRCNIPQGDNDCDKIPKDCSKIGNEFIDFLGQHAVEVHHFRCQRVVVENETHRKSIGYQSVSNGDYQKNNDIGDAIAGLNIAKEIAGGFRGEARGFEAAFFAGEALACTSKPKQCCVDSKSFWRRLTGCRESEQRLAVGIAKGLCHEVGTYRVKNSLLQKIGHVDKKGYCCFPSKLSRIIQEGARRQLQLGFGAPESPDCRALSITEIQRIDWSGIDFREIAADFIEKAKNTSLSPALQQMIQNQLSSSLSTEAAYLKNNYPNTPCAQAQEIKNKVLEEKIKAADLKRRLKGVQIPPQENP